MTPQLPESYMQRLCDLEDSYLRHSDPLRQSGFSGGPINWRAKRGGVLDAVERDGTFLDVGCANGYLLECLVAWAAEQGKRLIPYGVDAGPRLVQLAQERLPTWAGNMFVGNIWDWVPPTRFTYVSTSLCVPDPYKWHLFERLVTQVVAPGGRLILRCYYRSQASESPHGYYDSYFDNLAFLQAHGIAALGRVTSDPPGAEYVWLDC